jgi:hypothetical protein
MARAFAIAICGLVSLGLVACGGEDAGRPGGARVVAPQVDECEAVSSRYELSDIIRFEDVGRASSCESSLPTGCSFYFNHDPRTVTPNQAGEGPPTIPPETELCLSLEPAVTDPPEVGAAPKSKAAPDGARCGTSQGVLRFTAKNVGQCYGADGRLGWGASLDLSFVEPGNPNNVPLTLDASGADGVGFWVKRASPTQDATAMLTVVDVASNAVGMSSVPHCGCFAQADRTFICSTNPGPGFPDEVKCDPFGAAFTITDDWSFIALRFSKLTQKGFGYPLTSLDTKAIVRLQFLVNHGSTDFYVDDIALFRDK